MKHPNIPVTKIDYDRFEDLEIRLGNEGHTATIQSIMSIVQDVLDGNYVKARTQNKPPIVRDALDQELEAEHANS